MVDEEPEVLRLHDYGTPRSDLHSLIPLTARNILELGCSVGALGTAIKLRQPARYHGVEISPEYARIARTCLDCVDEMSVEEFLSLGTPEDAPFDCLIAADILEHLVDPWTALFEAVQFLSLGATVVVSVPNVLWAPGLFRVVRTGRWPRDPVGVFDGTHLRRFGLEDALDLLRNAGLEPQIVPSLFLSDQARLKRLKSVLWRTPIRRFLSRPAFCLRRNQRNRPSPSLILRLGACVLQA